MKKTLLMSFLCSIPFMALAQTNCKTAASRLQNYAAQINQFYNQEYWTVIPNVRCPAVNAFGQPFNPVVVQNCRLQTLGMLNNWYGQQCANINNWYIQIMNGCTNTEASEDDTPAPDPVNGSDENVVINTKKIKDLKAGVDEEQAVRITIPTTAAGFRP